MYHARLRRAFDLLPKYSGPPPADVQEFYFDDLQGVHPEVKCRIADEPYGYPARLHIPLPEAQWQNLGVGSHAAFGSAYEVGATAAAATPAFCDEREFRRQSVQSRCLELQLIQTRGSEISGRAFIPQIEAAVRQPASVSLPCAPARTGGSSIIYPAMHRAAGVSVPHPHSAGLYNLQAAAMPGRRDGSWTAALPFDASRLAGPQLSGIPAIDPAPRVDGMPATRIAGTFDVSLYLHISAAEPRTASAALKLESTAAASALQLPKPAGTLYLTDTGRPAVREIAKDWLRSAPSSRAPHAPERSASLRQTPPAVNGNGHSSSRMMPICGLIDQLMGPMRELRAEALPIRHDASPIAASSAAIFELDFGSTYRGLPMHAELFACFPNPACQVEIAFDALPMEWARREAGINLREGSGPSAQTGKQIIPINRSTKIEAQVQGQKLEAQPQFNTRVAAARIPEPHSLLPTVCEAQLTEARARVELFPILAEPGLTLGSLCLSDEIAQAQASRVFSAGAMGVDSLAPAAPQASAVRDVQIIGSAASLQFPSPAGSIPATAVPQGRAMEITSNLCESTVAPNVPERTLELIRVLKPSVPALAAMEHTASLAAHSQLAEEIAIGSRELRAEALPIRHSASPVHLGFLFSGLSASFEPTFEDLYDSLVAAENGVEQSPEWPLEWKMTPAAAPEAKIAAAGFAQQSSTFELQFAAIQPLDSAPALEVEPHFPQALSQIRAIECRAVIPATAVPPVFDAELATSGVEVNTGNSGMSGGEAEWMEPSGAANFDMLAELFGVSGLGWAERTLAGCIRPEVQAVTLPMCAPAAPAELVTRATPQQVDALQAALAFSLAMFPQPAQLLPIDGPQAGSPKDSRPEGCGEPMASYLPAQDASLTVGPDAPAKPMLAGQPWAHTAPATPEDGRTAAAVLVSAGRLESNLHASGAPVHLPECITLPGVLELGHAPALDPRAINQKKSALAFGFRPVETDPRLPALEHDMGPLALKIFVPKSWSMIGITEPEQRPAAPASNLYSIEDPLRRKPPTRIGGNMQHYLRGVAAAFFVALLVWASSHSSGLHAKFQGSQNWVRRGLAQRASIEMADNFHSGLERWQGTADVSKSWSFDKNGYIHVGHLALYRPSIRLTDYKMEFLAQIEHKSMGWVVRAIDSNNYYAVKLTITNPGPKPMVALVRYPVIEGKAGRHVQTPVQAVIHNDRPYRVQVEVKGNVIRASVEGQTVDTWTDDNLKRGGVGFFSEEGEKSRLYWVKVSNHDDALGRMCAMLAPRQT